MHTISAGKLADLLREGFSGQIQFKGTVYARLEDLHAEETNAGFYESRDTSFVLFAPVSGRKGYCLQLGNSTFRFEQRKGTEIHYFSEQRYGDVIVVPITLHECASLQIEPRDILF